MSTTLKISELIESFIADSDIKPSSRQTYTTVLKLFFRHLFTNKLEYYHIGRRDIIEYKQRLTTEHKPKTVNLYLSVLKRFYTWAETMGYYTNIAKGLKMAKVPNTYRRMPLTVEQVGSLLSEIDTSTITGKRDHAIVNLMVKTGLRRVEINRLDVGDLKVINNKHLLNIQRKGHDSKDQYKPISIQLFDELQDLICTRSIINDNDPLFISYSGSDYKRLSLYRISEIVKTHLKAIGLNDNMYTAHSLRHTAAILLLESGYDLHYVQMYLGHSSTATTQLYAKVISDRIQFDDSGINALEKALKIPAPP